jgi:DNA-binding Lrp family transcriptional regulator
VTRHRRRSRAPCAPGTSIEVKRDVGLRALGRDVQALIGLRIRPPSRENIEGLRDWVAELPETVGVFVVSGGEDFLVHVAVPNTDGLYAFVIDRMTERPEVAAVRTSVVYEHLRRFALEQLSKP